MLFSFCLIPLKFPKFLLMNRFHFSSEQSVFFKSLNECHLVVNHINIILKMEWLNLVLNKTTFPFVRVCAHVLSSKFSASLCE